MTGLFDATMHKAVAVGSCVLIADAELVYAGPLRTMPDADGAVVLLNPADYSSLTDHINSEKRLCMA